MNLWQEFKQPVSISEAIEELQNAPKPVLPIAGGTDLLLDMRQGHHAPVHTLIDVTGIAEMNVVELRDQFLFIGAAVSVNRIIQNEHVIQHAQALIEACSLIAGPQVRNTATLGGNVAHALPAADGTIALTSLDTQVEVASKTGLRKEPIVKLFVGPGQSAIDKDSELISGFYLPLLGSGEASCFKRLMRPQGVALPILNCAIWLKRKDKTIKDIRIAIGPGGPTPFRATATEAALRDMLYNEENISNAIQSLLEQAKFRTSPRRATADYRRYVVTGLFRDTLSEAWARADRSDA